jgi:hypothetical protein
MNKDKKQMLSTEDMQALLNDKAFTNSNGQYVIEVRHAISAMQDCITKYASHQPHPIQNISDSEIENRFNQILRWAIKDGIELSKDAELTALTRTSKIDILVEKYRNKDSFKVIFDSIKPPYNATRVLAKKKL